MCDRIKRKRSENWLDGDKQLLLELVRERVHILENKNTDTNTNNRKKRFWDDLLNSFNMLCSGSHRTITQLKVQWGIAKMNEKKVKALERRHLLGTGGGPPAPILSPLATDISSWLPQEFAVDINNNDSNSTNIGLLNIPNIQDKFPAVPSTSKDIHEIYLAKEREIDEVMGEPTHLTEEAIGNDEVMELEVQNRPVRKPLRVPRKKKSIALGEPATASKTMEAIAKCEIDCRNALHAIQMQNEEKKRTKFRFRI